FSQGNSSTSLFAQQIKVKAMFSPPLPYDISDSLAMSVAELISSHATTSLDNIELMSMLSVPPPSSLDSLYPSPELVILPQMFPLQHSFEPLVPSLINLMISSDQIDAKKHLNSSNHLVSSITVI